MTTAALTEEPGSSRPPRSRRCWSTSWKPGASNCSGGSADQRESTVKVIVLRGLQLRVLLSGYV